MSNGTGKVDTITREKGARLGQGRGKAKARQRQGKEKELNI